MISVMYELGRVYQQEREREAAAHRVTRQAAAVGRSQAVQRLLASSARQVHAWVLFRVPVTPAPNRLDGPERTAV